VASCAGIAAVAMVLHATLAGTLLVMGQIIAIVLGIGLVATIGPAATVMRLPVQVLAADE
jgi:hypothetical protein